MHGAASKMVIPLTIDKTGKREAKQAIRHQAQQDLRVAVKRWNSTYKGYGQFTREAGQQAMPKLMHKKVQEWKQGLKTLRSGSP